jgi:hypothetical protein
MNINSFIKITNFIGTKNNKYGLDKPDNFLNILDSFNELNNQNDETIYFFNLTIEEAQLDPNVLNFYLNFFEKSSDRLIEFEKLKSSGKINFELDQHNIGLLTQGNVEITSKLLSIHNIPIDDKFFLTFRHMSVNRRIEFLEFLKSKNPSFLSNIRTNNDFSKLIGNSSLFYHEEFTSRIDIKLLLPHIINDKYFVNLLQNKSTSDFEPFYIISKLVSVSDDINDTLSKLGESGNDFYSTMKSGDMLFFGYYKMMFSNFDNFINLFNFFGEEVVTKFFIECYDRLTYRNNFVERLVKYSQENKEYVLSMENFWVILKEKHPKVYHSSFGV